MQHTKRGNPHHLPKQRKRGQQCPSSMAAQPVEPSERARLTLHDRDPLTAHEDTLYTLCYEFYRGYTIYSTLTGRCCIHGKQGCLRLRGKFVCFPDIEDARTFIQHLRREGYTASDSIERYLPEWAFVCLNQREPQRSPLVSQPMQRVS